LTAGVLPVAKAARLSCCMWDAAASCPEASLTEAGVTEAADDLGLGFLSSSSLTNAAAARAGGLVSAGGDEAPHPIV